MDSDAAVSVAGLTSAQAAVRLRADGPNILPTAARPPIARLLLRQMVHFFALMLWVAAALAAIGGMPALAVAIVIVVLLNGTFSFVQEYRADRAAARLRDLLPSTVQVARDGVRQVIDAKELVAGDQVLLDAGDRVCADLRLERAEGLALNESMLTGESAAVHAGIGDRVRAGTFVIEGTGAGTVTATGGRTELAGIAELTRTAERPPSPLSRQLNRVVTVIAGVALALGVTFFGITLLLGTPLNQGFLFAVGVTVALVPEGLLPTVTLSLARAAQQMAGKHALVRHLEAVETLGSTTFICTDKTGTLTQNRMSVVAVWTTAGDVTVEGEGYDPGGRLVGSPQAMTAAVQVGASALHCVTGRAVRKDGSWVAQGDPTEVALHVFGVRCGHPDHGSTGLHTSRRFPFDPRRRRSSVLVDGTLQVIGAADSVLPRCSRTADSAQRGALRAAREMSERGLRVMAVARRPDADTRVSGDADAAERDLELLGLVGLQDPPRSGIAGSIADCRRAGIKIAMVTGDHPGTARALAEQVGLLTDQPVLLGADLPSDEAALGELLDHDGVVIARVTPEDKLNIAHALQRRGHVVAMTGDGVNDGPALREADIGVAMGASGTDVAREAADLVLLDDSFQTIVTAVELGRATFANIRRFLTYHLTDNVAELTPFAIWVLTLGHLPLALGVLQILALDIGTDLLPALALGAEPPSKRTMDGPVPRTRLMDARVLRRAFGVLGPAEAIVVMGAFTAVLMLGGWRWGAVPDPALLATASGTAFAAVVLGQLTNAYACRSTSHWVGAVLTRRNPLLPIAIAVELVLLLAFLGVPPVAAVLGGSFPSAAGWALAMLAIPAVVLADLVEKTVLHGIPTIRPSPRRSSSPWNRRRLQPRPRTVRGRRDRAPKARTPPRDCGSALAP
ncbi:cation-translocating P-type ATPase [Nakamurella sp. GG22]